MTEVKADTRRAMEPEFQRLRRAHDGEMESLLTRLSEDDKSLRDAYEKLLRERMSDEERAWKTSSQIRAREALDTASMELEALEAGHKESIKKTSRQLRTEIDAHKAAVTAQLEDEKVRLKASLRRIKEEQESQLGDLRDAHRQGVEQLHGDHEEAVRRLRLRDQAARAAADRQHETDMSSVAAARAGRGSSSVQAESASSVAARDSRVQEEIRRLQTETIKLERAMKTKIDHEKKAVAETAEREIDASERSFSRLQSETSELIVQKEALLAAIHRTSTEMSVLQEQRMDAESELNMLENGIRQAENESARRQEQQVRERREELDAITSAVERSHQKFIAVQKLCMEQERAQQEELKGMERDFERALEDMDHNVLLLCCCSAIFDRTHLFLVYFFV